LEIRGIETGRRGVDITGIEPFAPGPVHRHDEPALGALCQRDMPSVLSEQLHALAQLIGEQVKVEQMVRP
jgi:hypothetical protein